MNIYQLVKPCETVCSLRQLMWFATMTVAPMGAAFGVPVLALAVRRYTHRPGLWEASTGYQQ